MRSFYFIACILASLVPFFPYEKSANAPQIPFMGWPTQFEGKKLKKLSLSKREQQFAKGFPGKIARFTAGKREIVIRWVTKATRKLHPASDCFRALGYKIKPLPFYRDKKGNHWGSFRALKKQKKLIVRERIFQLNKSWSDVSSWYWSATVHQGPWWVITVVFSS